MFRKTWYCHARRGFRSDFPFLTLFVPVVGCQSSHCCTWQILRKIAASYFRQVGPSLNLPMHPSPGARLPDIILMYFVCATPFDIAIRLLPADTHRSVRSLVPSIPSEANRRISVCCPWMPRLGTDSREFGPILTSCLMFWRAKIYLAPLFINQSDPSILLEPLMHFCMWRR